MQSSGDANKLPTAWQFLIIIHFAHPIPLHFPLGEGDCRHQHGQVPHLQDSKVSRNDDDVVCQLRPGVTWVVTTAPRNHFPIGLSFSLCSCRKGEERKEEVEGKKKREKQAGRIEDPAMDAKALGDNRGTKPSLFLGLMGMCYPVSWSSGKSTALKEIKTSREAEKMWVQVMSVSLLLSSYPSLIFLIGHSQTELRGLGSLAGESALEELACNSELIEKCRKFTEGEEFCKRRKANTTCYKDE